jgi:hypothetical protein
MRPKKVNACLAEQVCFGTTQAILPMLLASSISSLFCTNPIGSARPARLCSYSIQQQLPRERGGKTPTLTNETNVLHWNLHEGVQGISM